MGKSLEPDHFHSGIRHMVTICDLQKAIKALVSHLCRLGNGKNKELSIASRTKNLLKVIHISMESNKQTCFWEQPLYCPQVMASRVHFAKCLE